MLYSLYYKVIDPILFCHIAYITLLYSLYYLMPYHRAAMREACRKGDRGMDDSYAVAWLPLTGS